jgi:triphosphoribosyl-dephospho-CoA synthetase
VVALVPVLLLTGCGGSSTVKRATYVKSVCRALGNWKNTIQSAGTALQSSDPANAPRSAAKTDYVKFVSALATATQRTTNDLRAAGIPDEKNGKQVAAGLTRSFADATGKLGQAEKQARAIRTDSVSTFQLTATAVSTQIRSALQTIRSGVLRGPRCSVLQG